MTIRRHAHVPHPREFLTAEKAAIGRFHSFVGRIASSALGSFTLFWVTFLVPLATIPASDSVKLIVSILFSSWFQAWALPVLQRSSNLADAKRDAKADADHVALSHVATVGDASAAKLDTILGLLDPRGAMARKG